MRLKNQRFFLWFNKIVFPLFYLRHQGKSETVTRLRDGTLFNVRVNTSDILVIWEIWKAKIYDDVDFPIEAGHTVVDIGAHIGGFSIRAAKLAHQGRVHAYEASSTNYAMLEKNRQLNAVNNLHIYNRAVSHQNGELQFFLPGANGALGSLLQEADSPVEIVQATTLADIIIENNLRRVDYLKMDAEGAEYDILFNCSKDTLAKVRRLVMEYHEFEGHPQGHLDLVKVLHSHDFNVVVEAGIFPQRFLFGTGIIKAWRD